MENKMSIYVTTDWLTDFMEESSSEANSHPVSQDISCLL
jgi:hypothetical protein